MENQIEDQFTDVDFDVLSGMMIIFLNAAERIIQMIELQYEQQYRAGNDYKYYCKLYGKARADEVLRQQVRRVVRGDERNKIGKIIKAAKDFHYHMKSLNQQAVQSKPDNKEEWQMQDCIIHDSNVLCYMYALIGNCDSDDAEIKIISTLKALAKGHRVSDRIINRLKPRE
jgi:hypothetical protein